MNTLGFRLILTSDYFNHENCQRDQLPDSSVCMSEHTCSAVMGLFSSHYKYVIDQGPLKRQHVSPTDVTYRSNTSTMWKIPSDVIFLFFECILRLNVVPVYINEYSVLLQLAVWLQLGQKFWYRHMCLCYSKTLQMKAPNLCLNVLFKCFISERWSPLQ